jgi:uncharacterized protein DUF3631
MQPGQRFGKLVLVGAVTGGFHMVCDCGRDVIVKHLICSTDDTADFQMCRDCKKKQRAVKVYMTAARVKWVRGWILSLKSDKPLEEKEQPRLRQMLQKFRVDINEFNDWPADVQIKVLQGFLPASAQPVEGPHDTQLLTDIRAVFEAADETAFTSLELVEKLSRIPGSPWAAMFEVELKNGQPVSSQIKLAAMLKKYGIRPKNMRVKSSSCGQQKGYSIDQFATAFLRRLPRMERMA